MRDIYEQLKDYCDCVEVNEKDVDELINIISVATCWAHSPCENFLKSERREVIDLPSCADCPITFKPHYYPYDVESFKFYLIKIKGIVEEKTEITDSAYIESEKAFRIDSGLPKCKCKGCECGCEAVYKLMVEYDAGYEEIPDCLLPVFCNVLQVIQAKNDCKCCDDCGCDTEQKVTYASGDVVTVQLETDIGKLLVDSYKNQLAMISLYHTNSEIWGMVV